MAARDGPRALARSARPAGRPESRASAVGPDSRTGRPSRRGDDAAALGDVVGGGGRCAPASHHASKATMTGAPATSPDRRSGKRPRRQEVGEAGDDAAARADGISARPATLGRHRRQRLEVPVVADRNRRRRGPLHRPARRRRRAAGSTGSATSARSELAALAVEGECHPADVAMPSCSWGWRCSGTTAPERAPRRRGSPLALHLAGPVPMPPRHRTRNRGEIDEVGHGGPPGGRTPAFLVRETLQFRPFRCVWGGAAGIPFE